MTLSLYFPKNEITFPVIGTINCDFHILEKKTADLLGYPKFPIEIAKIGLFVAQYTNGFFSYLTEPMIAVPLSFADLAKSVYNSQDPASSTTLSLARIAFSSLVFAYAVQSTRNGSLRELSQYLWDSSKTAKSFLDQAKKGSYTDAEFSEPIQISVKSSWSKIISVPAKFINAILERIHRAWIRLKSLFSSSNQG